MHIQMIQHGIDRDSELGQNTLYKCSSYYYELKG